MPGQGVYEPQVLINVRAAHGWPREKVGRSKQWSKAQLANAATMARFGLPPQRDGEWPKNRAVFDHLELKYPGFKAVPKEVIHRGEKRLVIDFRNYPELKGTKHHPTLFDLLLVEPDLVTVGHETPVTSHQTSTIGAWTINISEDTVLVDPPVRDVIEKFVNLQYLPAAMKRYRRDYPTPNFAMKFGIPAPIIRLDMPPAHKKFRGVYEVEANVAGLGIAHQMGMPIAREVAKSLLALDINRIGYGVAPSRADQYQDLHVFAQALGEFGVKAESLPTLSAETRGVYPRQMPLWLRAGDEDREILTSGDDPLISRCLLLHFHGGGNKGYLVDVGGAVLASDLVSNEEPFTLFPNGFVMKPLGGWGTKEMYAWCPEQPFKKSGVSHTKMVDLISEARSRLDHGSQTIIQPFEKPDVVGDSYRIWRLYLIWDGVRYKAFGGFWMQRPASLRIHGSADAVTGPLVVR